MESPESRGWSSRYQLNTLHQVLLCQTHDRGLGLDPNPIPLPWIYNKSKLYITLLQWFNNQLRWCNGVQSFTKALGEVERFGVWNPRLIQFFQTKQWTSNQVPCGTTTFSSTFPLVICRMVYVSAHLSIQQLYLPPVCVIPCHVSPYGRATWPLYEHATCHPSSGDTCHLLVSPRQLYRSFAMSVVQPANCASVTCHVATMIPRYLYGCTACTVSCHMAMYRLYRLHFFCMFGKTNRSP